jgi:hypothetical protein
MTADYTMNKSRFHLSASRFYDTCCRTPVAVYPAPAAQWSLLSLNSHLNPLSTGFTLKVHPEGQAFSFGIHSFFKVLFPNPNYFRFMIAQLERLFINRMNLYLHEKIGKGTAGMISVSLLRGLFLLPTAGRTVTAGD